MADLRGSGVPDQGHWGVLLELTFSRAEANAILCSACLMQSYLRRAVLFTAFFAPRFFADFFADFWADFFDAFLAPPFLADFFAAFFAPFLRGQPFPFSIWIRLLQHRIFLARVMKRYHNSGAAAFGSYFRMNSSSASFQWRSGVSPRFSETRQRIDVSRGRGAACLSASRVTGSS